MASSLIEMNNTSITDFNHKIKGQEKSLLIALSLLTILYRLLVIFTQFKE